MSMMTAGTGGMFSGVNSLPLITPIRPSGMIPMSTRPDGLDHSTCVKKYPAGLTFQYPRIRTSAASALPAGQAPHRGQHLAVLLADQRDRLGGFAGLISGQRIHAPLP
jgi:hypothetical protein